MEAVFGEDLACGAGRDGKGLQQAKHGVAHAGEGLRGVAAADRAGVLGEAGIATPVQAVLDAPVLAVERQEGVRRGLLAGEAGDHIDGFMAYSACDLAYAMDAADLSGPWPVEIGGDLAAGDKFARLDPPVPLLDGAGDRQVRWRPVPVLRRPGGRRGGRPAQGRGQFGGEKRRRRRPQCRPSALAGWL